MNAIDREKIVKLVISGHDVRTTGTVVGCSRQTVSSVFYQETGVTIAAYKKGAKIVKPLRPRKRNQTRKNYVDYGCYIGQKIGLWTILDVDGVDFKCRCQCGRTARVNKYNVVKGKSKGCYSCRIKRIQPQ